MIEPAASEPHRDGSTSGGGAGLPLVVDLDGTLIRTDLLYESANQFVTRHPFRVLLLLVWLLAGRSNLKARLAQACELDVASLPYDRALLDWLAGQRREGRRLVLATASDRRLALAVADHLGLFDETLASDGTTNLKAGNKRDLLVDRYGRGGFDYLGDSFADLPVWADAQHAYVTGGSRVLLARVRALGNLEESFATGRPPFLRSLLRGMRLHQWVKNLLVLVPLFAAHRYGDPEALRQGLMAFAVFGLAASAVYLLNDLVDVTDDRYHASKRRRPFAAGDLSLLQGWLIWPLLMLAAVAAALLLLTPAFTLVLAGYIALTLAYSLYLKRRALVDVMSLAGLYTLRIIAGAAALSIELSFWLLTFSGFLFLSLAFVKRYSELLGARTAGRSEKIRGRGYFPDDLDMISTLGAVAGYISVLVLALYIQSPLTAQLYARPEVIWLACPLLLYWISRTWLITHRGEMNDDPIVFALKDRTSWLVGGCFVAAFVVARVGG